MKVAKMTRTDDGKFLWVVETEDIQALKLMCTNCYDNNFMSNRGFHVDMKEGVLYCTVCNTKVDGVKVTF
jgi:uncharacterized protein YbaR (Trm112 family)